MSQHYRIGPVLRDTPVARAKSGHNGRAADRHSAARPSLNCQTPLNLLWQHGGWLRVPPGCLRRFAPWGHSAFVGRPVGPVRAGEVLGRFRGGFFAMHQLKTAAVALRVLLPSPVALTRLQRQLPELGSHSQPSHPVKPPWSCRGYVQARKGLVPVLFFPFCFQFLTLLQ